MTMRNLMWTLAFGHHEDRRPTHGYATTREAGDGGVRQELAEGMSVRLVKQTRATTDSQIVRLLR
jgi:hypothetical protein